MHETNEAGSAGEMDTLTALVAEDEVLLRMSLSERLRDVGFHVLEAANGEEARRIIVAVGGADVVISDVHMTTKGEGIVLAKWLGQHYPEMPVILASGDSELRRSAELASCSNVTDFVLKPYSEAEMERLARMRIAALEK